MIYTSYFANLRRMPKDITPVSIALSNPNWYTGLEYKALAPTYHNLSAYKKYSNERKYVEEYCKQVLNELNHAEVVRDLTEEVGLMNKLCLICYEKPTDFCHRHIVADWLNYFGFACKEWEKSSI